MVIVRRRFTPSKYKSVITVVDGIKFRSIKEANYYCELKVLRDRTKEVSHFLMQVPFRLPGGVKYLLDFLVFYTNGKVEYVDAKGCRTPMYIMKKKMVESLFPIKIIEA